MVAEPTPTDSEAELSATRVLLEGIEEEALPIIEDISKHTLTARGAMGNPERGKDPNIPILNFEMGQLAILNQRLSERISSMGYVLRSSEEFYKRQMEAHKVRLVKTGEKKIVENEEKYITVAAGVADSMKISLVHDEFELYNQCQYRMDQFKGAYRSTEKTIDTIRSQVSYGKANEKNT